ncbi:LexA family transcriptional regulator [Metapseudomonas otitidis]|uniref:LexA family transcriptional regulator n=1 Tax=Metapseudomonas otitidis TaxID=319939 RepID=UPI001FC96400|nr:S24 family peptidase [Pseudomonas otitidis]
MNQLRVDALIQVMAGHSQADFAEMYDLNPSYLSQILSGHRSFGERAASNMEKKIGLEPGTLSRPPLPTEGSRQPQENVQGEPISLKDGRVPVVGMAKLGAKGFFDAIDYPVGQGDGFVLISSSDPNAYALKVVGDSMEPRIRNGEYVLIEPNRPYYPGDEVLVQVIDGTVTQSMIKVFMYDRDGYVRLLSVNDQHPPMTIDKISILKIHPVGAILKSSRYLAEA